MGVETSIMPGIGYETITETLFVLFPVWAGNQPESDRDRPATGANARWELFSQHRADGSGLPHRQTLPVPAL